MIWVIGLTDLVERLTKILFEEIAPVVPEATFAIPARVLIPTRIGIREAILLKTQEMVYKGINMEWRYWQQK